MARILDRMPGMAVVFCVRETEIPISQEDGNNSRKNKQI